MEMPPLPPYIYGREAGPNEKVYTEQAIREWYELCARMAREQERERCIQACECERVAAEETGHREDFAYNNAIANCVEAIRRL